LKNPDRRTFVRASLTGAAMSLVSLREAAARGRTKRGEPFQLDYAPHFGMFRHHAGEDKLDQLRFMHDEGFRALEHNGMRRESVEMQEKIARTMEDLGMDMGVFVAHAVFNEVTFASDGKEARERIEKDMRAAVEVARRVNAKWCTVVPGMYDSRLEWDYQTVNVVENLKRAAEICEPAGLTMVLEPLNPWVNHPGLFLTKIPQAYMVCRAVGSPRCKILNDLYHQQITEGHLIANIDRAWTETEYFQVGDNPGRKEPTTGEINYLNVFRHLHRKGFGGIVGMEHGNSMPGKEGERAVIDAYRAVDSF